MLSGANGRFLFLELVPFLSLHWLRERDGVLRGGLWSLLLLCLISHCTLLLVYSNLDLKAKQKKLHNIKKKKVNVTEKLSHFSICLIHVWMLCTIVLRLTVQNLLSTTL